MNCVRIVSLVFKIECICIKGFRLFGDFWGWLICVSLFDWKFIFWCWFYIKIIIIGGLKYDIGIKKDVF